MANVYIRGGTRTEETKGMNIRRPKIAKKSIEDLVKRNMEAILRSQNFAAEDKLAAAFNGTNIAPDNGPDNFPVSLATLNSLPTTLTNTYLSFYLPCSRCQTPKVKTNPVVVFSPRPEIASHRCRNPNNRSSRSCSCLLYTSDAADE